MSEPIAGCHHLQQVPALPGGLAHLFPLLLVGPEYLCYFLAPAPEYLEIILLPVHELPEITELNQLLQELVVIREKGECLDDGARKHAEDGLVLLVDHEEHLPVDLPALLPLLLVLEDVVLGLDLYQQPEHIPEEVVDVPPVGLAAHF